ncbi:RNA recognition motif domain-containing protein [Mucilaginibacter terrae]|uniref:RNA recognition motif-containing protein n=1 Tax=Mucilaginibacter terrae TaxID=1955052 RepID=A0ABU3H0B9_9SPHI|nr:hypothetical protein [Mucilaginibacter terrae]MDT3405464.1 RNA recognition motif-containing protein [Mucilaginibacter terrae]
MTKLFIVGFDRKTTEDALFKQFADFGDVVRVKIITDQHTGLSKGFAFVDFDDEVGARLAVKELDGFEINERVLHVRFANRRTVESGVLEAHAAITNAPPPEEINQLKVKRPRIHKWQSISE